MTVHAAKICVPVTVGQALAITAAVNRAAQFADLIELRLDYLDTNEIGKFLELLPTLRASAPRPLILTMRPIEQGGRSTMNLSQRLEFWSRVLKTNHCYFDLELDVIEKLAADAVVDWSRIICSRHDFASVPENIEEIYGRMAASRARILKIAVTANDAVDCLAMFGLLNRAQRENRQTIALAMGAAGVVTRILGPSRGSLLTYASVEDESATAPGQVAARELREVYRIDQIDQETAITGLIGNPVSHSISPAIHNAAFADTEINGVYLPFEVHDPDGFIQRMIHPRSPEIEWNVRGLSVTAPHKVAVMKHLDWIHPAAGEISAVNTIVVHDGELHGYNTDAESFIQPLRLKFGSLGGLRCGIIGAGGAARAALWALRKEEAQLQLFAREKTKSRSVADEFGAKCVLLDRADFNGFDVVVNATPLGTRGELEKDTPATAEQLRHVRLVYDLVYNPPETRLLREARLAGCETLGGLEMLVAQAAAQFKLWTDKTPNIKVMRTAAIDALSRDSSIKSRMSNI